VSDEYRRFASISTHWFVWWLFCFLHRVAPIYVKIFKGCGEMNLNRLMWVFGGLFILFGLLMAIADGDTALNLWGGLSAASLGGFALAMAFEGVSKGVIRVQFSVIKRATHPRLFWAVVCLICAAGVVVLISAAWALFFK
jgi:hypothetical protein